VTGACTWWQSASPCQPDYTYYSVTKITISAPSYMQTRHPRQQCKRWISAWRSRKCSNAFIQRAGIQMHPFLW